MYSEKYKIDLVGRQVRVINTPSLYPIWESEGLKLGDVYTCLEGQKNKNRKSASKFFKVSEKGKTFNYDYVMLPDKPYHIFELLPINLDKLIKELEEITLEIYKERTPF